MKKPLKSKKLRFLIVFGPTREPIDPVRYISNYSSGIMGMALVACAERMEQQVRVIDCVNNPVDARTLLKHIRMELHKPTDIFIMAAAVCDKRPRKVTTEKIKKQNFHKITLQDNPDILKSVSDLKKDGSVFVGFALESSQHQKNAHKKLISKKLDLIVLQDVSKKNNPFGDNSPKATCVYTNQQSEYLGSIRKPALAQKIIQEAVRIWQLKNR